MKSLHIFALTLCLHAPCIHANDNDFYKGIAIGSVIWGSSAIIIKGISDLKQAYHLDSALDNPNSIHFTTLPRHQDIAILRQHAEELCSHGITKIFLGTTLGLTTAIVCALETYSPFKG